MGFYNTITGEAECPKCGQIGLFSIQFKYGSKRLLEYHLGDTLKWREGNDEGSEDAQLVLVGGASTNTCLHCDYRSLEDEDMDVDFLILIEENKLRSLFPYRKFWYNGFLILR